jgi:hypothetical protein
MEKSWVEKRKNYYSMIQTYSSRREALRKKYATYIKISKSMNRKIAGWHKEIKRIDTRLSKISVLERAIFGFTGVRVADHVGRKVIGDVWLAKAMYYKFGLENGMRNADLRGYIGLRPTQSKAEPALFRSRLTKSFLDTPENKEAWLQFKKYYEKEVLTSGIAQKRAYSTRPTKNKAKIAA